MTDSELPLPNFFIIGAMRSGTTSLAGYLGAHPDIFIGRKEPHFFDRRYDYGLDWYRSGFAGANRERAVGEATQTYMYDRQAPRRMFELLPRAKLVAILRNPVDRAYSHYWLNRAGEKEQLSFEDALDAESSRLATGDPREQFTFSYIDRGRYLDQLLRVLKHYPRESLKVLLLDDLKSRTVETYLDVCRFLGVDDSFVPDNLGQQVNRHMNYRSMWLRDAGKKLPYPLNRTVQRLNSKFAPYPPMNSQTRVRLREIFEEPNSELARWLERDLSVWA